MTVQDSGTNVSALARLCKGLCETGLALLTHWLVVEILHSKLPLTLCHASQACAVAKHVTQRNLQKSTASTYSSKLSLQRIVMYESFKKLLGLSPHQNGRSGLAIT